MLRRPPPLPPGAPVAVVAPASAPRDPTTYETGLARLKETYDVRTAWTPEAERGYLAAPDADRVAALHGAIEDPEIRGIICVRGGYGCLRLLSQIDWALARTHPTLLVGYSDVTALHLALYANASWTGLSGPVVTEWAEADAATLNSFGAWSQGDTPSLVENFDASLTPLAPGTATGPLLGGNLAVLTRLIGTPFAPDLEGAILVLEEVAEAPYRVDRMLAHLELAGVLDAVAGVLLGEFTTGEANPVAGGCFRGLFCRSSVSRRSGSPLRPPSSPLHPPDRRARATRRDRGDRNRGGAIGRRPGVTSGYLVTKAGANERNFLYRRANKRNRIWKVYPNAAAPLAVAFLFWQVRLSAIAQLCFNGSQQYG